MPTQGRPTTTEAGSETIEPLEMPAAPESQPAEQSTAAGISAADHGPSPQAPPPQAADAAPGPDHDRAADIARERELRNTFANSEDPTEAALELASFLTQCERHDEALLAIEVALGRNRSMPLRLARAGLLRDLARCREAATELQDLQRELGAANLAPGALFEMAELEGLADQRENACATMRTLQQVHAADPWLLEHGEEVAELARLLAQPTGGFAGRMRDLLALLRGAPAVTSRLRLLDRLAVVPNDAAPVGADDARTSLRLRAIAIACADDSPAMRARAVQLASDNGIEAVEFWRTALADPAALVRRFAAEGAARRMGRKAAPALLQAIAEEADASAFRALHEGLAESLAIGSAPSFAADTEVGRAAAVAYWRRQCDG